MKSSNFPYFSPLQDPGPSFQNLLHALGLEPFHTPPTGSLSDITHATTVLAVRYAEGVLLAGDRRATSGHAIAHRKIEKVFPADHYSGIAIAGAAGPALEMVKLFQLQLEHYEKVEGKLLSLEGKANQLSQMVRSNLPAAFQGLGVVPLFAGYDQKIQQGRLYQYDVTGGRYEESDFAVSGSGGVHASTVLKLGFRENLQKETAINLALSALFHAADQDTATGGPDIARGIYPLIAVIDAEGFSFCTSEDIKERFEQILHDSSI